VIEKGVDVEFLSVGDIVSVPFNVACGRCRTCRAGDTGVCLTVNPGLSGGAYGYVDMGGWIGGQARYVMTPYADFNLLKLPNRDQALARIRDLTMLTDILPTGFHAAVTTSRTGSWSLTGMRQRSFFTYSGATSNSDRCKPLKPNGRGQRGLQLSRAMVQFSAQRL
jgi:threonine dehydrogenase-like Zn-dependent dehydrogenase